jgi:LacI family transcriptional regulator
MLIRISAMPRKVSSYDVARAAGVSQTTVSLVLNGRESARIPDITRQRVRDVADQLGYVVHSGARALATGRANRIGMVPLEGVGSPTSYHYRLVEGVLSRASEAGQHLLVLSGAGMDPERLYQEILGGTVDGVLLVGRSDGDPLTQRLAARQFPTVCVAYEPSVPGLSSIDVDHYVSGTLVANHLRELGHKRAVFASHRWDNSWTRKALSGFSRAFARAGTDVVEVYEDRQEGHEYFERIIRETQRPLGATAIYTMDGWSLPKFVETFQAHGIVLGRDIALISGPEDGYCELTGISAIEEPLYDLGQAAADHLLKVIDGESPSTLPSLRTRLNVRQSSLLSLPT